MSNKKKLLFCSNYLYFYSNKRLVPPYSTFMKTVRIISNVLHACSLFLAVGYCATALYAMIVLTLKTPQFQLLNEGRRFAILFPFSTKNFLLGENIGAQMVSMVSLIGLYGLFFYMVSTVVAIFREQKWFTKQGMMRLRYFTYANLTIPAIVYATHRIFWEVESPAEILVALHALLGVFALFIAAIFEQGLHLQNEQDLII